MKEKLKVLKSYFIITLGVFINSIGWTAFLIPAKIVGGGLYGVSSLINFSIGFPIGLSYLLMNVILILIAIKTFGGNFGVKTIYGIVTSSFFITIFENIFKQPLIDDRFLVSIIGGILSGAGVAIYFTQGASTGGTDIIAMIITKYRDVSPGRSMFFMNLLIISSSYLLFHSIEKIIYGIVVMAVSSYSLDMILEGSKQSAQVMIFSEKYREIAEKISTEIRRGVTVLEGYGWYTKNKRNVLMIVIRKKEVPMIMYAIKSIDKNAFISIGNVMGVYGKGFEKIRR